MSVYNPQVCTISCVNTLKAELNPMCHLLALLGAHLIFHVSRIRVNLHLQCIRNIWRSCDKYYNIIMKVTNKIKKHVQQPSTYKKPEAASAILGS
jgi:hypothetical protein